MKLTRRRFLLAAVPVSASLYVGGWWFFNVRKGETSRIIISVLKKKLYYLNISNQTLEAFVSDFQASLPSRYSKLLSWAGMLEPAYSRFEVFNLTPYTKKRFEELEEHIISNFLLSSDFFYNDAREDREIKYMGLYPYASSCSNPFARFS
jgi:hypothetical protein